MEENLNPIPEPQPEPKSDPALIARGRELIFVGVTLLLCVLLCNFVFYGGFHLAFGIASALIIVASTVYLLRSGRKLSFYSGALLAFTMSLDDFVISYFVHGPSFVTLPIEIYSYVKKPTPPRIYAMFTLLFLLIFVLMVTMNLLQIRGRSLTPAEERYAQAWLDMGFDDVVEVSQAAELVSAYTRIYLKQEM